MCDYSLHAVASRPARIADKLMTTTFRSTATRGLCAPDEPNVAVCLMPGTELVFDADVRWEHALLPFWKRTVPHRVARFRCLDVGPNQHQDALEFPGGRTVLLTDLVVGQSATVLQLPAQARDQRTQLESAPEQGAVPEMTAS
jgi:hypothetical protein